MKTSRKVLEEYVDNNQSFESIASKLKISSKTLRRNFSDIGIISPKIFSGKCLIIMDTVYIRRGFGIMVFRDHYRKRNIHWKYVPHETNGEYISGIEYLKEHGWDILGIVCDGKRGILNSFGSTPVQLCQFHQIAIVTRYITRKPKLFPNIELKEIVSKLTTSTRDEFESLLFDWHERWEFFLKQKSKNPETHKAHYTHKRLRSAYRSLVSNLPYLFTYLKYPELNMPNTSNSIEGKFSRIKTKLRNHTGLKLEKKKKILDYLLSK